MRRLKKGVASPEGNEKKLAPSRKNSRFSGKNNGKRVRLVRRWSTSVSAKSVLMVKFALRAGVTLNQMQRDQPFSADDRFMWSIDPFLDGRSGAWRAL